jgi:RNA polymerase sigma-70 factor (ECF subfamily)
MGEHEKLTQEFPRSAPDHQALEAALGELMDACAAAWPGLAVDTGGFLKHVAERIEESDDVISALRSIHGPDLYLAFGCASGAPRALAALEERFLPEVAGYIAQIDRSPMFADEVRQTLRERLLVASRAEGGAMQRPKIAEYTGRGALGAWLRVSSVRIALNMRRGVKREVASEGDKTPELRAPGIDPEMDYLKTRYKEEFKEVFKTTLESLSGDERTVLRLHYLDGLTLDQIAVAYRVHRSTAARWLAQSREKIVDETKRLLQQRLNANPAEVESLLAVVRSQLDVSIYKFLNKDDKEED